MFKRKLEKVGETLYHHGFSQFGFFQRNLLNQSNQRIPGIVTTKRQFNGCCHHVPLLLGLDPNHNHNQINKHNQKNGCNSGYHQKNQEPHGERMNNPSDYAFDIKGNNVIFGHGVLKESGYRMKELGLPKGARIAIFTDKILRRYEYVEIVIKSLQEQGYQVLVYDEVQVEPTDISFKNASKFVSESKIDGIISVGGGSVMDTAKAASLYAKYPPDDFLDYVNPPIGRGIPVPGDLHPHIACPTTSGTGSECTGFSIFDLLSMKAKTGIAHAKLKPSLALVDPTVTYSLPKNVVAASGFDVLSHGLESYTAIDYRFRRNSPFKLGVVNRPLNQGSNPYSDMGCLEALRLCGEYIVRAVQDPNDTEARDQMMFAATIAGTAMGGAGVHLCHGMSYSISGLNRGFKMDGYPQEEPLIPHGVSVIINAPSVFKYISSSNPKKHLKCAEALGADIRDASPTDAGDILYELIIDLMKKTGMPNGISDVGFSKEDIPSLIKGTFPQKRVVDNAPIDITEHDLNSLFHGAWKYW